MFPDKVNVPDPALVKLPVLVAIGSATVILPAPLNVIAKVPVIALPEATLKVNKSVSDAIVVAAAIVAKPVRLLLPLMLRIAPPSLTPAPLTEMASAIVIPPCKPSVAPEATVIPPADVPPAPLWARTKVPLLIVIELVLVLFAARVMILLPTFVNPKLPEAVPLKV